MSLRERNIIITLLLILLPIVSFLAGYFTNDYVAFVSGRGGNTAVSPQNMPLFWEAWQLIEDNFIGQTPDQTQLSYAAIRGAMGSLNDPYTTFLEPVVRQEEQVTLRGNFGGIGAQVSRNEDGQVILTPIPENPAANAGIQDGDILLAIDGQPITPQQTTADIAQLIRGEKETQVILTVIHPNQTTPTDIPITRGDILVPSVIARLLPNAPTIGHIQLSRFSGESANEMRQAIETLTQQGAQHLILDLRGNGGGLLDAAIEIADLFIQEGDLLYQESKQDGERTYRATAEATIAPTIPLTVLVDGGTASASEILAGALLDRGRATLIGQQTFGKGSVQYIYDLSDGSSIHVTSARWYTPSRTPLDQQGLTPNIIIEPSPQAIENGRDETLERAIQFLQQDES